MSDTEKRIRASKRSLAQQLADREKVAQLYVQGIPQHRMSEILGRTRGQIQYDLEKVEESWRTSAVQTIDAERQWQLRRLNNIEAQTWEAWEKSKTRRKVTKRFKARQTDAGSSPEATGGEQVDEQTPGDPRFLAIIMDCVKERSRLLGLYEPVRVQQENSGPGGAPIDVPAIELTDAQLVELVRLSYDPESRSSLPRAESSAADGGTPQDRGAGSGAVGDVYETV